MSTLFSNVKHTQPNSHITIKEKIYGFGSWTD